MAVMPIAWFVLVQSEWGGSFGLAKALEDAAYVTLFPATIVGMAQLLRSAAHNVDVALETAAAAASERARIDAIERERSRIDALVHDSVLTTFLLAAKATSPEDQRAAAQSAREAIAKLERATKDEASEAISVSSFAKALADSVRRQDSHIVIDATGASARLMPAEVASALSDATAQALTNSQQHAGMATQRLFRLKIADRQIKIVIRDDGPGFRPARISKSRLGLRVSIIERVEAVGGRVFIETAPGEGTTIVLEWEFS
jgi:signal transduction histidine kinase